VNTWIVIWVLFFLTISDVQAIFCDPSGVNPDDTATISKPKGTEKGEPTLNRFGNDDCVDFPPIKVTGYYISFSDGYLDPIIYALGGIGIPAGAIIVSDGVATQPEGNRFGCGNSEKSDRERIAARGFLRNYNFHKSVVESGHSPPHNTVQYVKSQAWIALHNHDGTLWTRKWPNDTSSQVKIFGHVASNGQTAMALEQSCN